MSVVVGKFDAMYVVHFLEAVRDDVLWRAMGENRMIYRGGLVVPLQIGLI